MMITTPTVNTAIVDRLPALPPTLAAPILEASSPALSPSGDVAAIETAPRVAPPSTTSAVARRRKRIRTEMIKRRRQTGGLNKS